VYYYSHDFTKNVCELFKVETDNSVNIARSYDYTPFGAVTEHVVDSAIVNLRNNFKFSSEFYDSELALSYYNYRHYNPLGGRWINRDPIEERGGRNLYAFNYNMSINMIDMLGYVSIGGNPWLGGGSYLEYDDGTTSLDVDPNKLKQSRECVKAIVRATAVYSWASGAVVSTSVANETAQRAMDGARLVYKTCEARKVNNPCLDCSDLKKAWKKTQKAYQITVDEYNKAIDDLALASMELDRIKAKCKKK